jgi:outer membrane PBP1 activator LpoA protein
MNSCDSINTLQFAKIMIKAFLPLIVIGLLLTSCASFKPQSDSSVLSVTTFCTTARAIYWDKEDTRETISQIKEHNAVGKKLCGWKGKSGW